MNEEYSTIIKHLEKIQGFVNRIEPDKLYMNSKMSKIFKEKFDCGSVIIREVDYLDCQTIGVKEDNIFNLDDSK